MVVEILVPEHQPENTLPDQRLFTVLDETRITPIRCECCN
jgi:hypothetical protein